MKTNGEVHQLYSGRASMYERVFVNRLLPAAWGEYDLIVSSALLEHIPRGKIEQAVGNLTALLKAGGTLLLIVTRRTWVTMLTGRLWWKTNLFEEAPVKEMLELVGYRRIEFRHLPPGWGKHMIVAEAIK